MDSGYIAQLFLKTLVFIDEDDQLVPAVDLELASNHTVHVITAWNPGDDRPSREVNDAANERLRALLVERGLEPRRAVGADPDSDHFEESWAVVGLDDDAARAIGASFGQVAVFRLSGSVQTVLACTEDWSVSRAL